MGKFVNRLTAINPLRTLRQVPCIFARPVWYSIAVSNTATTSPAANNAQPNAENRLKNAFTQLKSNISAAIPFILPKNPERMLSIFNEICKLHPDSHLVIVGDYKSYAKFDGLKKYAEENGFSDKITYTGLRKDVPDVMQAFDAFVLPSRYEGFGIVYIEAQAAGLMTFGTAKVVPEEVDCTPLMHFIDSQSEDKLWAKQILENSLDYERKDTAKEIENCGFEISVEAKKLQQFYEDKTKGN